MPRDTTIKNPNAQASYKQTAYIGSLVLQLTERQNMGGASEIIDALNDDKANLTIKVGSKVIAKS